MTEEQRTNLEAMAEEAFTNWQQTRDGQQAATLISAYAQCMSVLNLDRIAIALEFFRADYEKEDLAPGMDNAERLSLHYVTEPDKKEG